MHRNLCYLHPLHHLPPHHHSCHYSSYNRIQKLHWYRTCQTVRNERDTSHSSNNLVLQHKIQLVESTRPGQLNSSSALSSSSSSSSSSFHVTSKFNYERENLPIDNMVVFSAKRASLSQTNQDKLDLLLTQKEILDRFQSRWDFATCSWATKSGYCAIFMNDLYNKHNNSFYRPHRGC